MSRSPADIDTEKSVASILYEDYNIPQREKISKVLSDEQLVRLWSSLKFFRSQPTPLNAIFFLEAISYDDSGNKKERLKSMFRKYLSLENKLLLLNNYWFTQPYFFRNPDTENQPMHLCYLDTCKDEGFFEVNSYDKVCLENDACTKWLKERSEKKINKYINLLVGNLVDMRNSVVHQALPTRICSDENTSFEEMYSVESEGKRFKYVYYRVDISSQRFLKIVRDMAGVFLKDKYLSVDR